MFEFDIVRFQGLGSGRGGDARSLAGGLLLGLFVNDFFERGVFFFQARVFFFCTFVKEISREGDKPKSSMARESSAIFPRVADAFWVCDFLFSRCSARADLPVAVRPLD